MYSGNLVSDLPFRRRQRCGDTQRCILHRSARKRTNKSFFFFFFFLPASIWLLLFFCEEQCCFVCLRNKVSWCVACAQINIYTLTSAHVNTLTVRCSQKAHKYGRGQGCPHTSDHMQSFKQRLCVRKRNSPRAVSVQSQDKVPPLLGVITVLFFNTGSGLNLTVSALRTGINLTEGHWTGLTVPGRDRPSSRPSAGRRRWASCCSLTPSWPESGGWTRRSSGPPQRAVYRAGIPPDTTGREKKLINTKSSNNLLWCRDCFSLTPNSLTLFRHVNRTRAAWCTAFFVDYV